jgi:hypothetical protein
MADLPVGECALAGPRFIARNPMVIGAWTLMHFVVNFGLLLLFVGMAGAQLQAMQRIVAATPQDSQAVLQAFAGIMPAYVVLMLASLIFYAVLYGSMNRAVLRPQDSAFAYLRLGLDELRQGLLVLIYVVLFLVAYFAAALFVGLIVGIMSLAHSPILSGLVILAGVLAVLALFIFLGVRLSLSSALTFDTGRLNVFGGWALSRGRFMPMFSVYLLCAVQVVLLTVIGGVILWLVLSVLVPGGDVVQFFSKPDMGSVGAMLSPARLVYTALSSVMFAVTLPVCLMSGPAIYRAVTTGRAVGEVFS